MNRYTIRKTDIVTGLAFVVLLSMIRTNMVNAQGDVNLPSTSVYIEVFNGTQSYFDTKSPKFPQAMT